jgi:hypothetical protein
MKQRCYDCNDRATTVEHVPPKSFFPEGHRLNLITVPACKMHNNELSPDVEYVRNILTLTLGTNELGLELFKDKVLRSFDKSPALKARTLKGMLDVQVGSQSMGMLTLDLKRFDRLMQGIVRALHYHETRARVKTWAIVPLSLIHRAETPMKSRQIWKQLKEQSGSVPLTPRECSNPEVFSYSSACNPSAIVGDMWFYDMTFYGGFLVRAFGPAPRRQPIMPGQGVAV